MLRPVDDELDYRPSRARPVLLALAMLGLLVAAGYALVFAMAPTYDPSALLEKGKPFEAEIISAQETGDTFEGQRVWELELQVRSDEGRGHRAFHQQPFDAADEPQLVKTTVVQVVVDPEDRRKLWVTAVGERSPASP